MSDVRNLEYIRAKDPRLYETIKDLIQQHQNLAQQTNGNSTGQPLPPPPIDGVTVTGQNGHFHIQIQHRAEIYRGIQYYAEFADNAGFQNPHTIHMGDAREHTQFLGNGTYFWRAYAAYASSPPGAPAYHGGTAPKPVSGGGSIGGPALLPPQGSGTGTEGEGLSGPGPVPFRSLSGIPPKRGESTVASAIGTSAGGSPGGSLLPGPETGLPEGMVSVTPSGGSTVAVSESLVAQSEWLTGVAGTNTITATTVIPYQALSAGFMVRLIPAHTNTGAVTLNVNSIGASAVTKNGSTALTAGELQINRAYLLLWDGTRWQIIGVSLPISATVLGSDANGNPVAAALTSAKFWIGSAGNLPVEQAMSGDATLANTGALTLTVPTGAGTYTPTLTNVTNVSASTAYGCQYLRVGNTVTVSGRLDVDPVAAAASTEIGISLPIASTFAGTNDCGGTGASEGVAGEVAPVFADAVNDRARMLWITSDATNHAMYFSFTYHVI